MNRILFASLAMIPSLLFAQNGDPLSAGRAGSWAMSYSINLSSATIAGLGLHYYLSPTSDLRTVVRVSYSHSSTINDQMGTVYARLADTGSAQGEVPAETNYTRSSGTFSLTLAPGWEWVFGDAAVVQPYVGIELPFTLNLTLNSSTHSETRSVGYLDGYDARSKSPVQFMLGGFGFTGFENFIGKRFALGAEYRLGAQFARVSGASTATSTNVESGARNPRSSSSTDASDNGSQTTISISTGSQLGVHLRAYL